MLPSKFVLPQVWWPLSNIARVCGGSEGWSARSKGNPAVFAQQEGCDRTGIGTKLSASRGNQPYRGVLVYITMYDRRRVGPSRDEAEAGWRERVRRDRHRWSGADRWWFVLLRIKIEKATREPVQLHITSDIGMRGSVTGRWCWNARVFQTVPSLLLGPFSSLLFHSTGGDLLRAWAQIGMLKV